MSAVTKHRPSQSPGATKKRSIHKQVPSHWQAGRSRREKSELVRDNLLWAAAEVVGEVGYAAASITLITQKAGVAQGTFYNYFDSRQDILDVLLPSLGSRMLDHIRHKALGGRNFAELEERGFLGFFDFLEQEPHFFRILNEAESFAPTAHKSHFDAMAQQYVHFLQRSYRQGEFPAYEADELEAVVFMLMAARSYLAIRYVYGHDAHAKLPHSVAATYMKFVRYGLEGVPPSSEKQSP
ncbi:TetR family transcriptional regulator [Pollutimonas nitritireducens]|uniref:TetR family transcriptional regulator n=1 Tax=Pollutimonas nitritireducens TaxID=2045209 RepID=A0A2N4UB88_9BURK|nr:TetR/AcrR family transcriptional regulator [Pollutimonas nitritireducens]PLC52275.1 TetR family transcriptional regulator [Pollutimonas nitritireducens]